jgi:hypothetical protein
MRGRKLTIWIISLAILFILFNNSTDGMSQDSESQSFKIDIIGARSWGFGGPCPPNLTEPCTWDAQLYHDLYVRLTYTGNTHCNITTIKVWHQISYKGITYNHTGPVNIPEPAYILKKGYFYEFDVQGVFYPQYLGNITVEVATLNLGRFIITTGYKENVGVSIIASWVPQTPSEQIIASTEILVITSGLFGLKRLKKRTTKKNNLTR